MTDYGRNFGFRRSGGDAAVREGRYRVPAAGDFYQGDLVTIDTANPGQLKKADSDALGVPGLTGLLIQEYELASAYDNNFALANLDSAWRGKAKNGYLATIWYMPGLKIWLRNTDADTTPDGHERAARAVFSGSVSVGSKLGWTGSAWDVDNTNGVLQVLEVSPDGKYLEAITL